MPRAICEALFKVSAEGCHQNERACRRCSMSHIGSIQSHLKAMGEDQIEQMAEVSGELHERDQWVPHTIHYDCYAG